jgi:Cysteine rich repeat
VLTKKIVVAAAILLLSTSGAMAQMRQGAREGARAVLQACKPDIARFCSQVQPGQGRIKACMKEHLQELSEPCKEGLFQAWLRR